MAWNRKIRDRQPRLTLRKPAGRGTRRRFRLAALLAGLLLAAPLAAPAGESPSFEREVRPILKAHCFQCHGENAKPRAGSTCGCVRTMKTGGDSGAAVVPGRRDESLIWDQGREGEMPPADKKLSAREKAALAAWIDRGAPTARPEPARPPPGPVLTEEEKSFWSFQPIRASRGAPWKVARPRRPQADRRLPPRTAGGDGLGFSPEADSRTLDPPAHVRPDRPAADARGSRRLPRRPGPGRLRAAGRPPAREPPLRRALGAALARRRRLRRQRRLHRSDDVRPYRLQVSRLRHPLAQRRQAVGRPDPRATRRRRDGHAALRESVAGRRDA